MAVIHVNSPRAKIEPTKRFKHMHATAFYQYLRLSRAVSRSVTARFSRRNGFPVNE